MSSTRKLPGAVWAAGAVALLAALALWLLRPTPPAPAPALPASDTAASRPAGALTDEQLQRMVAQSQAQLQRDPSDVQAWAMLAHSNDMLGRFAESSAAYAKLAALRPKDAQVLADYADALAVAQGRRLDGEPLALVERALAIDPRNAKALALAGTAAFERHDAARALAYWQRARDASPDAAFTAQIDASLADARALQAGASAPAAGSTARNTAGNSIAGTVTLADALQSTVPADATLYVFARPVQGSRMPVAILRKQVRDLPLRFTLDDSQAMVAGRTLSGAGMVVVGARISRRGDVMPQPGDLQGWSAPVSVGTQGLKLEISEVLK